MGNIVLGGILFLPLFCSQNDKSKVQVGEAKESDGEYPFFTSGEAILHWKEYFVDGRNCFLDTGGNADVKFYFLCFTIAYCKVVISIR